MGSATESKPADRAAMGLLGAGVVLMGLVLSSIWAGWWQPQTDPSETWLILAAAFSFVVLGALILWKADGNRVGWLFAAVGLSILLSAVTEGLALLGVIAIAGLSSAFWLSLFVIIGLLFLWFPTGRAPGRSWRGVEWLGLGVLGVLFFASLFAERVCLASDDASCIEFAPNPIGIPSVPNPEYEWLSGPLFLAVGTFLILSLASLVGRLRKAEVVERLQLKWFLTACAGFLVAPLSDGVADALGRSTPVWMDLWFTAALLSIPVSATVAILRYRLYDIDRIISRTVSYALMVGVLGVVFVGVVTGVSAVLPSDNSLAVAASTLVVAALFNPVRRRVQQGVDRRFNRSRYDAERVMEEFAGSLQDQVDPVGVVDGWVGVVAETMQPSAVGVWVRES